MRRAVLLAAALAASAASCRQPAVAAESAAILVYHRFGETGGASTNIRLEQFQSHIEELKGGGYAVLPVPEIVAALRAGRPLPERAVGITIDGASRSVHAEAWPRLRAAGLPFTLFVATAPVDRGHAAAMSWTQVRELAESGVVIGHHTASGQRLAGASRQGTVGEIAAARARFRAELGREPGLFAYPAGVYSLAARAEVEEAGFAAAFGQQSGVVHSGADRYALPRFVLSEDHGGVGRLRLAANALPLPAREVVPRDPVLVRNPPNFGFTVEPGLGGLERLACYASGQGRARVEILGGRRVEVRLDAPFRPGRARINCTLDAGQGRWRWLGVMFYAPPR